LRVLGAGCRALVGANRWWGWTPLEGGWLLPSVLGAES
jgi:hypothetical protein